MRNGCLKAVLGVFVLGGGFWAWTQWSAPRLPDVPFAQLPAPEKARRRTEAKQLEAQVRDVERAAKAHEKKPFSLEVSDEQLNTLLQDRLDLSKFPVRNLRVGFEPERVVAVGDVDYKGFVTSAQLEGSVALSNGTLTYQTDSLLIGGLPAPGNWKEKLDKQVTQQLNRALKQAPGRIDEVRLEQGKMIVSGQTD